ncbi:hypothetical protein CALCODRAFT_498316 [Calocera cornea HHB12733]|uniref:N-acetyltransferase domain-containing protein n=1 Tax=Calocera cornea HHB12733 TaxID=1353952 RepID=A0A165EXC2_9BASI|nr:hypothetical protein CALCODRAFT_498316 [Calocera cornea HHB12733]
MPLYAALSGIGPEASWVRGMLHSHCPRDRADLQPPKLPERHRISIVELGDPVALLQLAKLLKAFRADLGGPRADNYTLEQGIKDAEAGVRFREFMLYSVQDAEGKEEVAGCVRTGRLTSRHGAVRNVFTLPHYRRQGIAQALTHAAILRLLSEPNPMRQVLATLLPPGAEPDIEDALIFAEKSNMSAQGIYARAGYGFPVRDREEEEGNRWEDCVELGYGDSGH